MAKSMATTRYTTRRKELLQLMRDSYLFESDKQARYMLGAVCTAIRAWLLANTASPAKSHQASLRLPGIGTLRIGWHAYQHYSPKVSVRFRPLNPIAKHIEQLNRVEHAAYQARKEQ